MRQKPYSATPDELRAIDEALAETWPEYLLIYATEQALLGGGTIHEAKRLITRHPHNAQAVCWARQQPAPMVLWRLETGRRTLVWENQPGMAFKAPS